MISKIKNPNKPTKFLDPKHKIFEKLETKGTRRPYLFVFRKRQEGPLLGSSSRGWHGAKVTPFRRSHTWGEEIDGDAEDMPAEVLPEGERVTTGDDFGGERATVRLTERRRREWVREKTMERKRRRKKRKSYGEEEGSAQDERKKWGGREKKNGACAEWEKKRGGREKK